MDSIEEFDIVLSKFFSNNPHPDSRTEIKHDVGDANAAEDEETRNRLLRTTGSPFRLVENKENEEIVVDKNKESVFFVFVEEEAVIKSSEIRNTLLLKQLNPARSTTTRVEEEETEEEVVLVDLVLDFVGAAAFKNNVKRLSSNSASPPVSIRIPHFEFEEEEGQDHSKLFEMNFPRPNAEHFTKTSFTLPP